MRNMTTRTVTWALICGACALTATSSWGVQTVNLRAEAFIKTVTLLEGGTRDVVMWGFALDGGAPSVPGPAITIAPGETELVINLANNLAVPISIVIPGQRGFVRDAPHATFTDAQGRTRAHSFVKETPAGGTGEYRWTGLRPGTYLYHSGSHPALQVQMGLYGMLKQDAVAGRAYGISYAAETNWIFGEIDFDVHDAVQAGAYGTTVKSMIHSVPEVYLLNGEPYQVVELPLAAGQTNLLRLLNACFDERIPVLNGFYATLLAEDGRAYPYPKVETAIHLPALKTRDALLVSDQAETVKAFDRRILTVAFLPAAPDTAPPMILSVLAVNATNVRVRFSEGMELSSAQTAANYSIDNGITVNTAALSPDTRTVTLTTSTLTNGNYLLTVNNVADLAIPPNIIVPNSQAAFTYTYIPPVPPAAPASLTATLVGLPPLQWQINLAWNDNSANETGFRIERAPVICGVTGVFSSVGTVGQNVTSFTDSTLVPPAIYVYRVFAFNDGGDSPTSNVTTPIMVAINLALASRGSTITGNNGANWGLLIDGVTTGYTGNTGFGYTLWRNAANAPGSMTLDLKGLCAISSMRFLLWDLDSRYYQYRIEASSNSTTWVTIVDRTVTTNQCRSWQDLCIDSTIRARYLRLTGTYNSSFGNNGFHVVEWQVYGAPPAPAILTSTNEVIVPIGGRTTFRAKLNAIVAGPTTVTVSRLSGDTNILVQSGGSLVFNTSNWDTYQTVTLRAESNTLVNASAVIQSSSPGMANTEVTATALHNLALASRGSTITGNNGANWGLLIDGVTTGYTGNTGFGYTLWTGAANAPGSMTLDLKSVCAISSMRLLLWDLDNRYYWYRIEASSNGTTWITIVNNTAGTWRSWQDIRFSPTIQARYLRLTGTLNSSVSNNGFHVVEWEVYGTPEVPQAILTSANAIAVPIGGTTNFHVKLNTIPVSLTTVTVSRASGDTNIVVQSGGSLVFNASNWDIYQPVTLQAGPATPTNASAVIRSSASGIASADVIATAIGQPPVAPSNLRTIIRGTNYIIVGWTDNSGNELGFYIERSPDGVTAWTRVGQTTVNATAYRNTGLTTGTLYYYRAQAYNAFGVSGFSNVLPVTTR